MRTREIRDKLHELNWQLQLARNLELWEAVGVVQVLLLSIIHKQGV